MDPIGTIRSIKPRRFTAASAADNRSGSVQEEMRRFVIH